MPEVSDHSGELNTHGAHGGLPVFWRSAPSPSGNDEDRAPVLYLHGVPTSSDDWVGFRERYVARPWWRRWWRPMRDSDDWSFLIHDVLLYAKQAV